MKNRNVVLLLLELLWWAITAVIVWAVLSKIEQKMYVWPFQTLNVVFIVVFITLVRYTFFLKHTFLAKPQILKIALMLLMFPVTFMLINYLNKFTSFVEQQTWDSLTGHLPPFEKLDFEQFLWNEMLFFGIGSILAAPAFAIRMMISIWRTRNLGTT
ncbi:MAG: hypothetical protein JNJ57_00065 [Saprospiraceae bacterium]|nr:hypothetical protein [Saprospiraceae bacterium]